MANEFFDLFNQLFYSTEVWTLLGVMAIITICILIVKKEPLTFFALVIGQMYMMITYFDHVTTEGFFVVHIILLMFGSGFTALLGVMGARQK